MVNQKHFTSVVIFLLMVQLVACVIENYNENLVITPLVTGHVSANFLFTITREEPIANQGIITEDNIYDLFPRSFGEILKYYSVKELHFSLTQGLWKYHKWGYPARSSPPGAELWVWFEDNVKNVDSTWEELTNALSGIFCASLNSIGATNSISPFYSFRPLGVVEEGYSVNQSFVRYASLPRENVCTENLTPWKKLLPCQSKRGLSTLLNAKKLYNSHYHSIAVDYKPICKDLNCNSITKELTLTLTTVHDMVTNNPNGKQDWSFKKLFDGGLGTVCPFTKSSKVYVDITTNKTVPFHINMSPHQVLKENGRDILEFDIEKMTQQGLVNLKCDYDKPVIFGFSPPPPLHATRYLTGYGLEVGGVVTKVSNTLYDRYLPVMLTEKVPWFLRVYFHTLTIQCQGKDLPPAMKYFKPGADRQNPHHLELLFSIPPRSTVEVAFQFERVFLKWLEYPPDANHGFYVGSSILTSLLPHFTNFTFIPEFLTLNNSGPYYTQLHTETLLISLPTPDFSMPYNVICLACTVVALAFGPLHNLTTNRLVIVNQKKKGLLSKIKAFFRMSSTETSVSEEKKQN